MTTRDVSRRAVLAGACGTCGSAVAGCATYVAGRPAPTAVPAAPDPGFDPSVTTAPGAGAGTALAATADIPVGGGKIIADRNVVVGQPTEGKFVAFSATCTHQGCAVATITGNTVNCPCHGSQYALADGSVVTGPATKPLSKRNVKVVGGQITFA
jgi:Rieske Fe-S protein